MLYTVNTSKELTELAIKDFKKSYYGFISRFDTCYTTSKDKIFHQYCSAMYGSQFWNMTSPKLDKIYSQWRKVNRQVLGVLYMTHFDMLPIIANNMPLYCIIDFKYVAFYKSIEKS